MKAYWFECEDGPAAKNHLETTYHVYNVVSLNGGPSLDEVQFECEDEEVSFIEKEFELYEI